MIYATIIDIRRAAAKVSRRVTMVSTAVARTG